MPSVVIGKVKGDKGEPGYSPIVTLERVESTLSISVTDAEGTKTESINTQANVQSDWLTTDTALDSYIKNKPEIPSKISQLQNDSGYLTEYTETDPTVPAWAKKATKPEYTAVEVGALSNDTTHLSGDVPITRKINGKTLNSDITLLASDIGALPDTTTIPSVGNGTITITQNGTTKGTFTTNQSGNTIIELTDDNTTYGVVSTSENGLCPKRDGSTTKFLRGDGTWAVPATTGGSGIDYSDTEPTSLTAGMTWIGTAT